MLTETRKFITFKMHLLSLRPNTFLICALNEQIFLYILNVTPHKLFHLNFLQKAKRDIRRPYASQITCDSCTQTKNTRCVVLHSITQSRLFRVGIIVSFTKRSRDIMWWCHAKREDKLKSSYCLKMKRYSSNSWNHLSMEAITKICQSFFFT